jgi:hypothetical protein
MSIVDTGRFWEILVIPVLQILAVTGILPNPPVSAIWYNQYFPESSSIGNTDITSIFQNLPVSAILVLPVFSRICQYLQYWYYQYFPESSGIYNTHIFGNDQYLLVLQILENSGRYILNELNIIHTHTSFLLYIT